MSHELETNTLVGARFVAREVPGWHRLGRTAPANENATAEDWANEVTQGYDVVKAPLMFTLNGKVYTSDKVMVACQPPVNDKGREQEPREFGIASSDWALESYSACAKVFNELSKTYPVETAGLIKKGKFLFLSFKAEEWDVFGDKVESYITVMISMVPGVSHRVFHTPVRVVCNNTLSMGLSAANLDIKIPHESDSLEQMKLAADIVTKYHESKESVKKLFEEMAKKTLTVEEAEVIFAAAYPEPGMPRKLKILHEQFPDEEERTKYTKTLDPNTMAEIAIAEKSFTYLMERTTKLRNLARACYTKFDVESMRGTAWAAYQGVTEASDWRNGKNCDESVLFGTRAKEKERAFAVAADLVQASA